MKRICAVLVATACLWAFGEALCAAGAPAGAGKRAGAGAGERTAAARAQAEAREKAAAEARARATAEAREKATAARGNAAENRQKNVDAREARQAKRIEHGIAKGYLTPDEIAKLDAQQKEIAALEASFGADGKLTRDEFKGLTEKLNVASHCIWAEKHDSDGAQIPTFRLGRNIFAKSELTTALANENLPREQAKALLKEFHRLVELKRKLGTDGDLSADQRAKLQAEFNDLLNKYFEVREPASRPARAK